VHLDVLVGRIEHRDNRGTRLRQLAGPDELRLHDGRHVRRPDGELVPRHLQLGELGRGDVALLLQDVALLARQRAVTLLRIAPTEQLAGTLERAARLVAGGAHVVELLRGARTRADQVLLAGEGALGTLGRGRRLLDVGRTRAAVALPGRAGE